MRVIDWLFVPLNITVSGTTAASGNMTVLAAHRDNTVFEFVCNTACWIKQGNAPVATAGTAGEVYVPTGVIKTLHIRDGVKVAVIQDASGGKASICRMRDV